MRMLLVTNDFPPRAGGIQQYCLNLVMRLPADEVVVYAPAWPGAAEFDAAQPFRVVRHPTSRMLPGRDVERRAVALVREVRPRVVVFGAAFPLGLLAGRITRATGVSCVGWTHGVEVAVGRVPLVRGLMARVAGDLRFATAVSNWSAERVRRAVRGRCPVELLVSGVDAEAYHPGVDRRPVRSDRRGAVGRPAGPLRRRRRVRHALPHALAGPGPRSARGGLPRGGGDRVAGRGRPLRRRARDGRPGRHRPGGRRPHGRAGPARARAMGAAGRRRVEAEFAWPAVAARFEKLLAEAIG